MATRLTYAQRKKIVDDYTELCSSRQGEMEIITHPVPNRDITDFE